MVLYSTLFFPESLLKERVTVPVASMLSAALFLTAANSKLPDVSYTTALEYIFYIFFFLCLFCIVVGSDGRTASLAGFKAASQKRIDTASHILFPAILLSTIVGFGASYASRY